MSMKISAINATNVSTKGSKVNFGISSNFVQESIPRLVKLHQEKIFLREKINANDITENRYLQMIHRMPRSMKRPDYSFIIKQGLRELQAYNATLKEKYYRVTQEILDL